MDTQGAPAALIPQTMLCEIPCSDQNSLDETVGLECGLHSLKYYYKDSLWLSTAPASHSHTATGGTQLPISAKLSASLSLHHCSTSWACNLGFLSNELPAY